MGFTTTTLGRAATTQLGLPIGAMILVGPDQDDDGVLDSVDNCPAASNPVQANNDPDPQGDARDGDDDDDGLPDAEEIAMGTSLILVDTDGDAETPSGTSQSPPVHP